ncbi:MAG: DUF1367 family protein [Pseudohongiellaceae bacterium]
MTVRFLEVQEEGFGNVLVCVGPESNEWLQKQKPGKQFKVQMKASRNPDHHRKAFAMFKLVMDNHPTYQTIDDVLVEMKVRAGHYNEFIKSGNSKVAKYLREMVGAFVPDEDDQERMIKMIDQLEHQAKMVYIPKSISFDSMGQEEFEEIYEAWIPIACNMIGVEDEELRAELAQF